MQWKKHTAGNGANQSLLGTVKRLDDLIQVNYNKWPLYYYKGEINVGGI